MTEPAPVPGPDPEGGSGGSGLWHGAAAERPSPSAFAAMAEVAPVLIWASGPDKLCTYFNQSWLEFTGRNLEQELGVGWVDDMHPDDRAQSLSTYSACFDARVPFCVEYRLRHRDGQYRWVLDKGVPRYDANGEFVGYIGSAIDITESKLAADALKTSEAKLHAIVEGSPVPMAVNDEQGNLTFLNRRFVELFGYTLADVPTLAAWWRVAYPDPAVRERLAEEWGAATEKAQRERIALQLDDHKVTCKDGSVRDIRVSLAPLGAAQVVILYDMTQRNQMEERLRQSQKLEGIGQLAGGVAHEFNNILAAMMMNLNMAEITNSGEEVREHLQDMQALCRRAADVVRQLLAFGRRSVLSLQPMDLATVVLRQCKMLGRLLGEGITLDCSCAEQLPWVSADKAMVEQILLNLCLNARDAMPQGGTIRVRLDRIEIGKEQASLHDAKPGLYVCLSVADTGAGMNEQTLKHLFEPFFTTKPIGKGTGLGLAMVNGIVQQHHGWVDVQSQIGKGSAFRVYLPAVAPVAIDTPKPRPEPSAAHTGTILVVEDEPALRRTTKKLLLRNGYRVLDASDGKEALALWTAHQSEIDLLYTDLVMPGGFSGLQLARRATAEKPTLKVIVTSGYSTDLSELEKAAAASIVYLPKPSSPDVLLKAIGECLQSGG